MIDQGIRRTMPLRRFATLDAVSNAPAYLLSDYASFVTGKAFVIAEGQWRTGADYWGRIQQMAPFISRALVLMGLPPP
jgi:NAD(P)-dependent dehydrogenase (short-subunit alcohol dehydrogenase family)